MQVLKIVGVYMFLQLGHSQFRPPPAVKIGVLLETAGSEAEVGVQVALKLINADRSLLPNTEVTSITNYTGPKGQFGSLVESCAFLREGVVAVIGPMSSTNVKYVQAMTSPFHIPLIAPVATDPTFCLEKFQYILRMFPSDEKQSQALAEFLRHFKFSNMAILTDTSDYGMNGMVEFQALASKHKWRIISMQQFATQDDPNDVDATRELNVIKNSGAKLVVLNAGSGASIVRVLAQANHLGMMSAGWMWIGMDSVTGSADVLEAAKTKGYLDGLIGTIPKTGQGRLLDQFSQLYQQETASNIPPSPFAQAFADATLAFAYGLHAFFQSHSEKEFSVSVSDCEESPVVPWSEGAGLFRAIKSVNKSGVMHRIQFTEEAAPVVSLYNYVQLKQETWEVVGSWSEDGGTNLPNASRLTTLRNVRLESLKDFVGDMVNKTFVIYTLIEPPFVMRSDPADCKKPNLGQSECLEGYCIDLLNILQEELMFNVILKLMPPSENKYGIFSQRTQRWNGLISKLVMDEKGDTAADMALAPLTISSEREKVMSFTKPFRDLRMSLIVGRTEVTEYNPFSFLVPFETELWLYIILTTFAVGIFLAIVDKLSPYGHHGRKVQNESEDEFEEMDINEDGTIDEWERRNWIKEKEAMNFHNAIFWSFASFFEQGGEYHPRAWSGRIAAGAWWFGIVIIISTYTANLAAFLTIKTPKDQINSLEQLAGQQKVLYTMVTDTEIQNFFNNQKNNPYKRMSTRMTEWENNGNIQYFGTTIEAMEMVQNRTPNLALITDGPIADYWRGLDCENRRIIGNGFSFIGYGLGLPLNSPYREQLSLKILNLRERGFIDQLDYKWITKASTCAGGGSKQVDSAGQQIELGSMLGVFYVIYAGFAISVVILVGEWIVSCFTSIDPEHPRKPKSFREALEDKLHRLKVDIGENWFPFRLSSGEESLNLFAVKREVGVAPEHGAAANRASPWATKSAGLKEDDHPT